ncbi:MAG: hypothetical protein HRT54_06400 [Colwellia sp.]|nr:hypothetical protein [Colwellia sp.]
MIVPFKVNEHNPQALHTQVVSFSFPLSSNDIFSTEELQLLHHEKVQTAEFFVLSYWPNSSAKWVRCNFILDGKQNVDPNYVIKKQQACDSVALNHAINCASIQNTLKISNDNYSFHLHNNELLIDEIPWAFNLTGLNDEELTLIVTDFLPKINKSTLKQEVAYHGVFQNNSHETVLEFDCKLTFNAATPTIKTDFTLRNPKPMVHNNGKWDLGNKNSYHFKSLNLDFLSLDSDKITLNITDKGQIFQHSGACLLYQASSGGDNWNSSNHVDANGEVNNPFKGFRITEDTAIVYSGDRAEPTISAVLNNSHLSIAYKNFWQTFPKSIESTNNKVTLGLFPQDKNINHELQPGEQTTHTFFVHYSKIPSGLINVNDQELSVSICPDYLESTNAIPSFSNSNNEDITRIINEGLTCKNNFFEKRETMDEFGWRNFGDIYADHEKLEYKGDKELISHYNNQYDALYGFIRQFLVTGDTQWWSLATDLAQHVKDIDIYHTDKDKIEYNNGLFWHTDHYLSAETASHRTYSQKQQANAYQDHSGGGGPGGQHCYTTGLMLHYYLTADETSKTAVIKLADWITNFYEGSGTIFEFALYLKNRNTPGLKNKLTGQYPLDRGTGNYIVALLDAYELTNKQSYLDRVSLIIKHTANPYEDLAERDLKNIEESWFYTIFLQAVLRYLFAKREVNQIDSSYNYANNLLIHFSNWIVNNESPYLNTPEKLEYPNHTWAAQDIRKANVLYGAYYFSRDNEKVANICKNKADEFYFYVYDSLTNEKTRTCTRILAILMQNVGYKSFVEHNISKQTTSAQVTEMKKESPSSKLKIVKIFVNMLINTSLKKELTWLTHRSSKVKTLFGRYL